MQAENATQGEALPNQIQNFPADHVPDAGDALQIVSALTHAQDRDTLDVQLTHALKDLLRPATTSFYRLIPYGNDQRLLLEVELRRGAIKPLLARPWDPDALPKLSGRADLNRCYAEQAVVRIPGATGRRARALFPAFAGMEITGIVELLLDRPLTAEQERLAMLVLCLYRNQLSMIEYAQVDTLTGLLNRKTFESSFSSLIASINGQTQYDNRVPFLGRRRPPNEQQCHWLAMIDIDHFKRINDQLGHSFGDEVLLLIAKMLRASFRTHDQLYRFGGEEFVVVLDRTEAQHARHVFERFREKVARTSFPQVDQVTVSIGYTSIKGSDTAFQVFSRSDNALYYGKNNGRNQVWNYEDLIAQGLLQEKACEALFELF